MSNPKDERRVHDPLRDMVDTACKDLSGGTQERIKNVARKAYYLGVGDGIELQREKTIEDLKNS